MFAQLVTLSLLIATVQAQLTGRVGPLNSRASKSRICNVLDYGGTIGSNDIGPAIQSAYNVRNACIYLPIFLDPQVELRHQSCWFHALCSRRYASIAIAIHNLTLRSRFRNLQHGNLG
jgi:hypothetical protein